MNPPLRNQEIAPLAALLPALLCVIFGANAVAIKISLTGMGKFTVAGMRFAMAAGAIALWAIATGRRLTIARDQIVPLLVISALFTVQLSLFYLGLSLTFASRGALVVNVVPFFVLIFAHLFIANDRMTARKLIGMVLGFSGVALVLTDNNAIQPGLRTGDFIILLAATIWAGNAVYTKTIIHRFRPFQLVLYPMVCAIPVFFLEGWLWDGAMIRYLNGAIIISLVYQSLICAAIGFVIWNTLLQRYGASTLHSFIFIMPISGVIASTWLLNEPLTTHIIVAVVLVAVGIVLVNFRPKPVAPNFP